MWLIMSHDCFFVGRSLHGSAAAAKPLTRRVGLVLSRRVGQPLCGDAVEEFERTIVCSRLTLAA